MMTLIGIAAVAAACLAGKSGYRGAGRLYKAYLHEPRGSRACLTPILSQAVPSSPKIAERNEIALLLIGCIRAIGLHGDRVAGNRSAGFVAARSRFLRSRAEGHMQNKWFTSWRGQEDPNGAVNGAPQQLNTKPEEDSHETRAAASSGSNGFAGSPERAAGV